MRRYHISPSIQKTPLSRNSKGLAGQSPAEALCSRDGGGLSLPRLSGEPGPAGQCPMKPSPEDPGERGGMRRSDTDPKPYALVRRRSGERVSPAAAGQNKKARVLPDAGLGQSQTKNRDSADAVDGKRTRSCPPWDSDGPVTENAPPSAILTCPCRPCRPFHPCRRPCRRRRPWLPSSRRSGTRWSAAVRRWTRRSSARSWSPWRGRSRRP